MARLAVTAPFPWFGNIILPLSLDCARLLRMTTEQRFWAKVKKTNGCWIWMASKRAKGYGAFAYHIAGAFIQDRAHRYSWKIHKGSIPDGMCVLHNCPGGDNPACVNPAHLFLGTKAQNNTDMVQKERYNRSRNPYGRYRRGETHPAAKLNDERITEIRRRRAHGDSFGKLSAEYGIALGHVFRICKGTAWRHIR